MTNYFCDDPLRSSSWVCGKQLWRNSEFTPADVKVAQIYDAFTPLIPLALEGFGFCARGEAKDFVADSNLQWPGGRLPLNTSGGSLSEAYVHGFNLILEGVRQMRGSSHNQVAGAQCCLVASADAVPSSALILRK